jgi:hypothetical protein
LSADQPARGAVEIREIYPGFIWNAYDRDTGQRVSVTVNVGGGWWIGCRIGLPRRELYVPDGDVTEVTRRLIAMS